MACIGGPVEARNSLASNFQAQSILNQLKHICSNISNYIPRLDFFPKICPEYVDADIPGISELTARVKTVEASEPAEVPDVANWETEEQEIEGNGDAKCGNCSRIQ